VERGESLGSSLQEGLGTLPMPLLSHLWRGVNPSVPPCRRVWALSTCPYCLTCGEGWIPWLLPAGGSGHPPLAPIPSPVERGESLLVCTCSLGSSLQEGLGTLHMTLLSHLWRGLNPLAPPCRRVWAPSPCPYCLTCGEGWIPWFLPAGGSGHPPHAPIVSPVERGKSLLVCTCSLGSSLQEGLGTLHMTLKIKKSFITY
jgi:hypothetical protein